MTIKYIINDDINRLTEYNCESNEYQKSNFKLIDDKIYSKISCLSCKNCYLTNITYICMNFKNLIKLNCSLGLISELDNLPNGLEELDCSYNRITCVNNLPKSLKKLRCSGNKITSLDNLPNITYLNCSNNNLTKLDNLPNSLEYLNCENNQIQNLEFLPNLKFLNCSSNKINSLDGLPNSLEYLDCEKNLITSLDNLPNNLVYLNCSYNPINKLDLLPKSLLYLSANGADGYCKFIELKNLPPNLKELFYFYSEVYSTNLEIYIILPKNISVLVLNLNLIKYKISFRGEENLFLTIDWNKLNRIIVNSTGHIGVIKNKFVNKNRLSKHNEYFKISVYDEEFYSKLMIKNNLVDD